MHACDSRRYTQPSPFTPEQIDCICELLYRQKNVTVLKQFLPTVPNACLRMNALEGYHKARALIFFEDRNWEGLFNTLSSVNFHPDTHADLQKLWREGHYSQAELLKGRPLGAVEKYRIRKKFTYPRTIWDGDEMNYYIKQKSRNILKECFLTNHYPTNKEKRQLALQTGLTEAQISNWFKNSRQRHNCTE